MSISLATLMQQVKRKTRYGDISNTSDQITADIVHYINQRRFRIWRRYPWHWVIKEFSISITANEKNYTLDSEIGDIIAIDNNEGDYLKKITLKRYLQWYKSEETADSTEDKGEVTRYVMVGRDETTKALKIKVWRTPFTNDTFTGWGKKRITRYAVADIATNTDLEFFPEEVIPVLEAGVLADIYEAQGKTPEAAVKESYFNNEMNAMVGEATVEEDTEEESPLPDYMIFHNRKRGGTTVT